MASENGYALGMKTAVSVPNEVTQALDAVCEEPGTGSDEFVREAGRRVLHATDW
jgi:hypothetical protein